MKLFKKTQPQTNDFRSDLENSHSDPFVIKEGKYTFGHLKDSTYYTDWTEHSFLSNTGGKEVVGHTFDFKRLFFVRIFIFALLLMIIGRAYWLQIIGGNYYYSLAENNRIRIESIEPKRGIIYDANMKPLVKNKANFVLYFEPIEMPRDDLARDQEIRQVAAIIDGVSPTSTSPTSTSLINAGQSDSISLMTDSPSFEKIKSIMQTVQYGSLESYQPLFIADNIPYDRAMLLELRLNDLPGVFLSSKIRREYADPFLKNSTDRSLSLSHILGYTGKITADELNQLGSDYSLIDYVGKSGLEYTWEKDLKGVSGQKNIEVDALGRQEKTISETPAQDGDNLQLSIDSDLQVEAETVTQAYLKKFGFKRASVVIMNPQTGAVMALVSLPSYDNNLFAQGINSADYSKLLNDPNQPLFNRAISGEFPSGSTFKLVVSSAALQEKIITETTTVLSTGGLRLGQWFFPDWKVGGHGITDVKKALADSVNTFFYYVGGGYKDFVGLGVDRLGEYARLFGLGSKLGIDLPGEAPGFVPTQAWKEATKGEKWYIGDTYHFAIGQGDLLVTPLQVADFTATVANGGRVLVPHIVDKIMNSDNQVISEVGPTVIRENFIDSNNLKIVREGLRQTVLSGSARSLQSLPVQVAGKTGTAQWSSNKAPHAWFTGFAPYDNPQFVITVMVEEGIEGSSVSEQIAKEIMQWYFGGRDASSTQPIKLPSSIAPGSTPDSNFLD
jgi:penicillin-binding protein 2